MGKSKTLKNKNYNEFKAIESIVLKSDFTK